MPVPHAPVELRRGMDVRGQRGGRRFELGSDQDETNTDTRQPTHLRGAGYTARVALATLHRLKVEGGSR